ncbi:YcgL domain-containing protein [Modicisalibacter tunisiensis]|uniref:YcgL domain-containing protein KGQ91_14260 n=1 Tax=Modicisalibacter tunisiensis TaxID=390637 RepID=A0ABS7X1Q7_9GAMM|nr:YcgL domain-containing protein [Modicisalibacter tunisiensis]MBZ9568834.1 YcgL domain-containing protein [Modicisalibacter tunisiensis]
MERVLCEILRSPRRDEMYLYIDKRRGLEPVPEALLERFGTPQPVMTLLLDGKRKLARADAARVIEAIAEQGFYLQMPPARDEYLLDLYRAPTEARY